MIMSMVLRIKSSGPGLDFDQAHKAKAQSLVSFTPGVTPHIKVV